jgi:hypothetical protein
MSAPETPSAKPPVNIVAGPETPLMVFKLNPEKPLPILISADLVGEWVACAVQAERERCAAVAREYGWSTRESERVNDYEAGQRDCADTIEQAILKGGDAND